MKKKLSILLCACIALGSVSQPLSINAQPVADISAEADSSSSDSSSGLKEPKTGELTDITTYVKSKITIPKALTDFEYHYNSGSSMSASNWSLVWRNSDSSERVSVVCDSKKHILSYRYSDDNRSDLRKPVYLKKELKAKSDEFIKKTNPQMFSNLEYTGSGYTDIYEGTYSYSYRRVENGIPMPDNIVKVNVNYETGKIISFSSDWLYDIKIPAGETKITKEEAAKMIGSNLSMELIYQSPSDDGSGTSKQAYLVYRPNKSYLSIDAKTGKVYLAREEWQNEDTGSTETKEDSAIAQNAGGASNDSKLTGKEIESISKLENLISQKAAIQAIKDEKSLLLDENCTVISANLRLSYRISNEKDKEYVWDINFSDSRNPVINGKESYRAFASASVDAKDGKILSYYASTPEYYNTDQDKWDTVSIKYSSKECTPIFETFAKKQVPEYFNNAKLTKSDNDYIIAYRNDKPVYGGYNYNYTRLNESVLYPYNGFSGAVDGVTGKIYSFHTNWDKSITFQSTKGAMSETEAFNQYISKDGYGLVYEINTLHNTKDGSQKNEIRLVYRPDISPAIISPFTGKQLDYNGKSIAANNGSYTYSDINSSKNKRAILLLADLGIGFDGGKFQPTKRMTKGELEKMLAALSYNPKKLTVKESIQTITRMNAVKRLISYAELDKVATIKNIYKSDFKDQGKIAAADLGYAALAKGLGIVTETSFRGTDILTREEAAQMLLNLLKADY